MSKSKKARKRKAGRKRKNKPRLLVGTEKITSSAHAKETEVVVEPEGDWLAYDEDFYERARTQLHLGDWEGLTKITNEELHHHPARAKLALLVAAGHLQLGRNETARQFIHLAKEWGCGSRLLAQVLIAGVYNTLGRAAMLAEQENRGTTYFENAINATTPNADKRSFAETRAIRETARLGLLPQAAKLMGSQLEHLGHTGSIRSTQASIFETELELLQHELSMAQQRGQLYKEASIVGADNHNGKNTVSTLKNRSMSQLGQDLWVLEKTQYKKNGFFVEFGATDGVLLSNTYLLEKEYRWDGICIEPNPKFFKELKKNRDCEVSNRYIGGKTGDRVEFILADAYGGNAKYVEEDMHAEKRLAYKESGHVINFESISLDDFLERAGAPKKIDYISIDTEGSEFEIMKNFPFEKWKVRLFTIEHNHTKRREDIFNLMQKKGYIRTEKNFDDWYELTSECE